MKRIKGLLVGSWSLWVSATALTPMFVITCLHYIKTREPRWLLMALAFMCVELAISHSIVIEDLKRRHKKMENEVFNKFSHYRFREIPVGLYFYVSEEVANEAVRKSDYDSFPIKWGLNREPHIIYGFKENPGSLMAGYTSYSERIGRGAIIVTEGPWTSSTAIRFWLLHEIGHNANDAARNRSMEVVRAWLIKNIITSLLILPIMMTWRWTDIGLWTCMVWMWVGEISEREFRALWRDLTDEIEADSFAIERVTLRELAVLASLFRLCLRSAKFDDPLSRASYIRWSWVISNIRRREMGEKLYRWPSEHHAVPITGFWPIMVLECWFGLQTWNSLPPWWAVVVFSVGAGLMALVAMLNSYYATARREKMFAKRAPMISGKEIESNVARTRKSQASS